MLYIPVKQVYIILAPWAELYRYKCNQVKGLMRLHKILPRYAVA